VNMYHPWVLIFTRFATLCAADSSLVSSYPRRHSRRPPSPGGLPVGRLPTLLAASSQAGMQASIKAAAAEQAGNKSVAAAAAAAAAATDTRSVAWPSSPLRGTAPSARPRGSRRDPQAPRPGRAEVQMTAAVPCSREPSLAVARRLGGRGLERWRVSRRRQQQQQGREAGPESADLASPQLRQE
jgi:hypothetical protein